MTIRTLWIVGLTTAALAACGDKAASSASAPAVASPVASEGATLASSAITLDGEGLSIASANPILMGFGTPRAEIEAAVKSVMGAPRDVGRNPDCPNGPTDDVIWDTLTLITRNGVFVGWSTTSPTGPASATGLRVGLSRAEAVAKGAEVRMEEGFDQAMLSLGGMGGQMTEDGGSVYSLWAGDICLAT